MEEMNQQPRQKNGYWSGLLSGLLLALLLLGIWYIGNQTYGIFKAKQIAGSASKHEDGVLLDEYTTSKVEVIQDTIEQYYLDGVSQETLENGVYSGMVNSLKDPYSVYYSAEELKEIQMSTEGIYYGIGAYISKGAADEFCTISGVIENTPAQEADLREGDII